MRALRVPPQPLVVRRRVPVGDGPEHVAPDGRGGVVTGIEDGRILRVGVTPPYAVGQIGRVPGRPLGLAVLPDGGLLVCDAEAGLLRLPPDGGRAEVLADRVAGRPLRVCSNVAVATGGTLYFTSSSSRNPLSHWRADLTGRTATGRLMRLEPGGEPEVLADGLEFANGVVLSEDGTHLVVAETGARRLLCHWLTGPRAGETERWRDRLPGYPDNLTTSPSGDVWVALAAPVNPLLESARRLPRHARGAAAAAAQRVRPPLPRVARVLAFAPTGEIRHDLRRTGIGCRMITSVAETAGVLVLGSLMERHLTVCEPPLPVPRDDEAPADGH
ncbi:SMP-30/gluconolactonase/LRE family protein [Streptomyces sp. VRA16 Mangrove soil]|uniref:SMP-30/gluconolactonase/LRE family protein n=1 Tax=Streptomyces sp. VRA16 Mangrove soil TaxID=2817434 RepID=UPI001A9FA61B|nr:SMP-30/gluconolactonase/LRE family protein [Streptomyces sp. VRA16 Mangrove soil]MBO1330378.1 SMP-30/gluconolactonase/LRE family protein [Streptomyces sp. VRA16 Mangrove soil]